MNISKINLSKCWVVNYVCELKDGIEFKIENEPVSAFEKSKGWSQFDCW